jgi:hypothetical protein
MMSRPTLTMASWYFFKAIPPKDRTLLARAAKKKLCPPARLFRYVWPRCAGSINE